MEGLLIKKVSKYVQDIKKNHLLGRLYYRKIRSHKNKLDEISSFENIIVVPYEYLRKKWSIKGGPIWPNWHEQIHARHCRDNIPWDDLPENSQEKCCHIKEPSAWCGAIDGHFGHQIADHSTRILHVRSFYPNLKLIFSYRKKDNFLTFGKTPTFFRAILDWYNITPDNIEIIHRPTLVHNLMVAPQAEQLWNYGPSSDYLDLMDAHVERRLRRKAKQRGIFVSRAGIKIHFAGEAYIESLFSQVGIRVIRPEEISLEEQLAEYEASEKLIFTEGSALHGLQLLGRCIDHIDVLVRRDGRRIIENLLKVRAKSVSYIKVSKGMICILNSNGTLDKTHGIPIFNEDLLLGYLRTLDSKLIDQWNHALYVNARDHDIMSWLKWTGKRANAKNSTRIVMKKLNKLGLSHLTLFARECCLGQIN